MVILGLSDGPESGAALVLDDRPVAVEVQERHDRKRRSNAFPWSAIDEVLEEAGLRARHVEAIAIAGRISPPPVVRRWPRLRRLVDDPFSPVVDLQVAWTAMQRESGFGAFDADVAAEGFEKQFRSVGFEPRRVEVVDVHRCLAETAYRTQTRDELLVVAMHPMGDGAAVSAHQCQGGDVERVWSQKGFSSLHVHLRRCLAVLGAGDDADPHRVWARGARAKPDPALVAVLRQQLHAVGPRLSRRPFPIPQRVGDPVYKALAEADPDVAAASLVENLVEAATDVVRHHLRLYGTGGDLAVVGAMFDIPRVAGAIAALDGVDRLWIPPAPGHGALPLGAAATVAGMMPHRCASPGLGRTFRDRQCERAVSVAGLPVVPLTDEAPVAGALLAQGLAVGRFRGRSGWGRHGGGTRSVLVRADDPVAIQRVRDALGRPDEEPVCLYVAPEEPALFLSKVPEAARFGHLALPATPAFAARCPGVVARDGRVHVHRVEVESDPGLAATILHVVRATGCPALACFPLASGDEPVVSVPGDAIRVWRRSGLDALLLGGFVIQRPTG